MIGAKSIGGVGFALALRADTVSALRALPSTYTDHGNSCYSAEILHTGVFEGAKLGGVVGFGLALRADPAARFALQVL